MGLDLVFTFSLLTSHDQTPLTHKTPRRWGITTLPFLRGFYTPTAKLRRERHYTTKNAYLTRLVEVEAFSYLAWMGPTPSTRFSLP
jgi:hypothetical protein